jgi:polar amino acid transport system substrate-binding protein
MAQAAAAGETAVLFVDEPVPPFLTGEAGGYATEGISHDLVKEVFGRMDLRARVKVAPWARALKMVEHGRADGLPLLLPKEERKIYMVFSDPILRGGDVLIYNRVYTPDFTWSEEKGFEGLIVGKVRGYSYKEELLQKMKGRARRIEESIDSETNLRKLHAGRVDVVVEDLVISKTVIRKHPKWRDSLAYWDELLTSYHWHMGISKKSPLAGRIAEINAVLEEMRRDGALAEIMRIGE